jgi:hypothetical protein
MSVNWLWSLEQRRGRLLLYHLCGKMIYYELNIDCTSQYMRHCPADGGNQPVF